MSTPHTCLCLVIDHRIQVESPCHAQAIPDSPFCLNCEDRHPSVSDASSVTVTHLPLPLKLYKPHQS